MPPTNDVVRFEHVAVVRRTDLALFCDIDGRVVMLGTHMIELESTILNGQGHDGTLVLARWRAAELDLLNGHGACVPGRLSVDAPTPTAATARPACLGLTPPTLAALEVERDALRKVVNQAKRTPMRAFSSRTW
jgi:hypothetical protein